MRQLFVAVLLMGIVVPAAFGQLTRDEPSDEQLRQWVANLESDSYSARSVATERLILPVAARSSLSLQPLKGAGWRP